METSDDADKALAARTESTRTPARIQSVSKAFLNETASSNSMKQLTRSLFFEDMAKAKDGKTKETRSWGLLSIPTTSNQSLDCGESASRFPGRKRQRGLRESEGKNGNVLFP